MKVFVAEGNSDADFYQGNLDGTAARAILEASGIAVEHRLTLSSRMLERAIKRAAESAADVFHLSCHGSEDGITLTNGDHLSWVKLSDLFQVLAKENRVLVYASCCGGDSEAAKAFLKARNKFGWILGSRHEEGVGYFEACVSWAILYKSMQEGIRIPKMQKAINSINSVVEGDFAYRRWDSRKRRYRHFPSE